MKILFVDAGNYCRSPAAEAVCRALAAHASLDEQVTFSSAGLKDKHVGDTADPRTIEACAARGYDLGAFRCREISAADFAASDLILAMDRGHLRELRGRCPAPLRDKLRLMREFGEPAGEVRAPFAGAVNHVLGTPPASQGDPLAMVSRIVGDTQT